MSVVALSQKDRILRQLRAAGRRGVTPIDFMAPHVIDGGKPITRVAARIQDLRNDGFRIDTAGRRGAVAVYVLRQSPPAQETPGPPAAQRPSSPPQEGPGSLFDLQPPAGTGPQQSGPRSAIGDWYDDDDRDAA